MLGKGLESLIPSGGYRKPEENAQPQAAQPYPNQASAYQPPVSVPEYSAPVSAPFPQTQPQFQYQPINQQPQFQPQFQSQPQPQLQFQPQVQPQAQPYFQPQASVQQQVPAFTQDHGIAGPLPQSFNSLNQSIIPEERRELSYASRDTDDYSSRQDAVFQIEVEKIFPNPHQPRRYFDENALNDLANSIREFGIIQPLVVTKVLKETENGTDVNYQLIAGERRLLAARRVGLRTVPAVVKQVTMDRERLELAIIENIQRENLNPLEAARSYARLQDEFGLTQREIAIRMGKSRETIANALRLLNLPSEVQKALEEGRINESHARLLLQVTDQAKQREMFNSILHFKPSVRELKARLKQDKGGFLSSGGYANPELMSLQSRLEETLGTRVQINDEGEKGKIMISYYSPEELNDLIRKLSGGAMY